MDLANSWNNFEKSVVQKYDSLRADIHQRIEKFEIDHNLKSPPAPKLPYIELHNEQTNITIARAGNYSETLNIGGRTRHFILHVPAGYDPAKGQAVPLIVALHGFTQSASDFQGDAGLDKEADARHAAILYPDATKWLGIDIASAWYTGNGLTPTGARADDVGFLRQAIGIAENQIKVDKNRVDLLGVSNGGMMAYKAAAEMSDIVAAVVDISGAMSGQESKPPNPISVMSVVGTKDEIVPPGGRTKNEEVSAISKTMQEILSNLGSQRWRHFVQSPQGKDLRTFILETSGFAPTFKPVSYATDFWKRTDGIQGKPVETINGKVLTDYYQNPTTGVAVEQVVLTGMDHAAQGGVPSTYKLNDEAWAFLAAHPKYYPPPPPAVAPAHPPEHHRRHRSVGLRHGGT